MWIQMQKKGEAPKTTKKEFVDDDNAYNPQSNQVGSSIIIL